MPFYQSLEHRLVRDTIYRKRHPYRKSLSSVIQAIQFNPFLGVRMNRVIKISEVKQLTTLSNASIYRLIKLGEFPKQLKLAERSSGWLVEEVNNWLESKRIIRDEVQL